MSAIQAESYDAQRRLPRRVDFLLKILGSNWRYGRLTLRLPDGDLHVIEGVEPGRAAVLEIRDYRFARRLFSAGDIGFAEGYMAGEWDTPGLADLLEAAARNFDHIRSVTRGGPIVRALNWLTHKRRRNSRRGARRNIHAHYDLGNGFYRSWLDATMSYSSARYDPPDLTLEAAQTAKYAALAKTMDLRAGHRVLEIGCGWGGFAEYAAREIGAHVTGVTISTEQHAFARQRLSQAGLSERTDIRLMDYRDVDGVFDRVASIEMFEAVGQEYWPAYFGKIHDVLAPGGRAGLQIITIQDAYFQDYGARIDFIQKYIFPGGMLPSEERLKPVIAAAGLTIDGVDRFGADYARTLAEWDRRFQAAWQEIARMGGFDERFRRLWRFYLAYCEAGFRTGRTDVIQLGLSKA